MNETYVTSDLHFKHGNIIRYCNRPFKDADEMNDVLIRNWNETVRPDDTTWVLGDFCFFETVECVRDFLGMLNGHKILVLGNHDRLSQDQYLEAGFKEVYQGETMATICGTKFCMSHYQHLFWDGSHNGSMHLFGHEHWMSQLEPNHEIYRELCASERKFNVCVDANGFKPVNISEIQEILSRRDVNFKK